MFRLPRSLSSLGMLISVGKSLGREMSVGNPLSSADSSVGRSLGRVNSVDESDVSVLSVLVSAVVAVVDVVAATVSAAAELTAADPLTELPHAATARMVAAARARAAVTAEPDLMFTPADASRTGRSIVTVRRGQVGELIPRDHWDDDCVERTTTNRLIPARPRLTKRPLHPRMQDAMAPGVDVETPR